MKKYILLLSFIFFCFYNFAYNRIISISPAITEAIYLLNAQDKLIANTIYCIRPKEAKLKEKIGTLVDIDIEKIITLKPDIILTTTMTKKDKIDKLLSLGYKVEIFYEAKSYKDICEQFKRIGEIVGNVNLSEKIIERSNALIDKVKTNIDETKRKKVFVEIGKDPLFTVTKDSYINDLIYFAGGINIASNFTTGLCSIEKVIEANPEIIIIVDMGIDTNSEINQWKKYKSIFAVKNKKIFTVDAYIVCSANPETFTLALKEFVKIISPDIIIYE